MTALVFRIQHGWLELCKAIQAEEEELLLRGDIDDEGEKTRREEARSDLEFTIGEMLRMAVNLDYADEIGRRKMFQLVREFLRLCHGRRKE